jgi:hypothetical protein
MTTHAVVLPTLHVKSWPRHKDKSLFPMLDLIEALDCEHPSDAQLLTYRVVGKSHIPRLSKEAEDLGLPIEVHLLAADIDRDPHEPWDTPDQAKLFLMDALTKCPFATGYTTRRGIRLLWVLETPIPVSRADETIRRWYRILNQRGLDPDMQCAHWSRTYRLPRVKVKGEKIHGFIDSYALKSGAKLDFHPKIIDKQNQPIPPSNPTEVHPNARVRAIAEKLDTCPTSRKRFGDWLVGEEKTSGNRVYHIPCPSCGEESVWYLIDPDKERHRYARCNHENNCGWWGNLFELRGMKNG